MHGVYCMLNRYGTESNEYVYFVPWKIFAHSIRIFCFDQKFYIYIRQHNFAKRNEQLEVILSKPEKNEYIPKINFVHAH